MSYSKLVSYVKKSPNRTVGRVNYTRFTPHCVVGQLTVESLGEIFAKSSRKASSNYGIGSDGRIACYVDEENRSWCSSSSHNDNRAITVECACDLKTPFAFNDKVYRSLVNLAVDVCRRHGKKRMTWYGKDGINRTPASDEMILTAHRFFSNTACPGDWFFAREAQFAKEVTQILSGSSAVPPEKSEKLVVDGDCGIKTVRRLQERMGTPIDGVVSGQSKGLKAYYPAITSVEYGTGGSIVVEAWQIYIGAKPDGKIGKDTTRLTRRALNLPEGGVIDAECIKALQRWLNE